MSYIDYLQKKELTVKETGLQVDESLVNSMLFDFQRDIVVWALKKGRAAIFADCGLGKTPMQLAWADYIHKSTNKNVLILAPLAVSQQTVEEGEKFGIKVEYSKDGIVSKCGITISNYERLAKFNSSDYTAVVLDESSILKSYTGTTKRLICETFKNTQYKLACTATPSPNDHMELLNHSAFLGFMESHEALSIWFINDTMAAGNYRLKKHAEAEFWRWVCSWAVSLSTPSDLGYDDGSFCLPPLNEIDVVVNTDMTKNTKDCLFRMPELSATDYYNELKLTAPDRIKRTAEIVNESDDSFLVWCITNEDSKELAKQIHNSVEIKGSDSVEKKEQAAIDFKLGKIKHLISKASIFGFGLNFQNCHNTIFCGMSYSFEDYYQAVRRLWRFQQTKAVNSYLVIGETERHILDVVHRKEKDYAVLKKSMQEFANQFQDIKKTRKFFMNYDKKVETTEAYTAIRGDCIEEVKAIPDRSIGLSVFSPPFSNLYIYSDSLRDMGNCKDDVEFFEGFGYLIPELYRITQNGRLCVVHCKDLMKYKNRDGEAGLRDFPGDIVRLFEKHGWQYHSRVTIWKDPVIEMQRTKSHGLLYKQLCKDSSYSRQGCPDYLVVFRKWADEDDSPVTTGGERFSCYKGDTEMVRCGLAVAGEPNAKVAEQLKQELMDGEESGFASEYDRRGYSIHVWQRYASPVWFDIRQTNVLNIKEARDDKDEKHICPLQLDVIERSVELWSNPGDVVFSPFMGIGSEGYVSVQMGRRFIGIELKDSYFESAVKNLKAAENKYKETMLF